MIGEAFRDGLSRRNLLAGTVSMGLAGSMAPALAREPSSFAFDDPVANVAAMARLAGDLKPGGGVGRVLYRGRSFAHRPGLPVLALYGLEGMASTRTVPTTDGAVQFLFSEFAVFTDLETGEPLTNWTNPMTGRAEPVFHQRNGPVNFTLKPGFNMFGQFDAVDNRSGFQLPWTHDGDRASFALDVTSTRPNPLKPETWPAESTGETMHISEHSTYSVEEQLLSDPGVTNLPFNAALQSLKPFHPFMRMGVEPGFVFTRLSAQTISGLRDLDKTVAAFVEANLEAYLEPPEAYTGTYKTSHSIFRRRRHHGWPSNDPRNLVFARGDYLSGYSPKFYGRRSVS